MVDLLIKSGSNVNAAETIIGWTPLRIAARDGEIEIIEILLNNGADVHFKGDYVGTALDLARSHGYLSAVKILEEAEKKSVENKGN